MQIFRAVPFIKLQNNRVLCAWEMFFFPWVLQFSHSSPGMFGTGSLLHFPRLDLFKNKFKPWSIFQNSVLSRSLSLSMSISPPPLLCLCHSSVPFEFYVIYIASPITCHCHASILPSTGLKNNIAQTKTDKCPSSSSPFLPFNCGSKQNKNAVYNSVKGLPQNLPVVFCPNSVLLTF